jgi:hypothetical protein
MNKVGWRGASFLNITLNFCTMNKVAERSAVLGEDGEILSHLRGHIYNLFTINNGKVQEGALVDRLQLKGAGIEIPVLTVGEQGRGRERGVISVQLGRDSQAQWQAKENVFLKAAGLGTTKAGRVKLTERAEASHDDHLLAVLRTQIGYRGGNSHTGDRTGEFTEGSFGGEPRPLFKPFPGIVLERGMIAQGDAGRMGSGEQLISLIPQNEVFRTAYSGRLYGGPSAHYYKFDGKRVLSATWDERSASDLF